MNTLLKGSESVIINEEPKHEEEQKVEVVDAKYGRFRYGNTNNSLQVFCTCILV